MIDTHAHLYSDKFKSDIDEVLHRAQEQGVTKIVMPNIDVESIDAMLEIALRQADWCYPMMGLHPCSVDQHFEKQLYTMESWLAKEKFVGIGETGIDLYWDKTYYEQQCEALRIQATWAIQHGLPLILHVRDSMQETITLLEKLADEKLYGIVHCFTGNADQAARLVALGFSLGIGGVLTYKNAGLDVALADVSLQQLVLETDAPYLAPVPHRGKRNEPAYTTYIADRLAEVKGVSKEEVIKQTTENAKQLFGSL